MRINTVKATGFKKFVDTVQFDFMKNANALYGTNNSGKTTIAEIICIAFYGCDLIGSNHGLEKMYPTKLVAQFLKLPDGLNDQFEEWSKENKGSYASRLTKFRKQLGLTQETQPSFETFVQFENNEGVTWKVLRTRTYGGNTTVKLNGDPVSQTELNVYLPPKELFYAIFVPGYFLNIMSDKEQRSLLLRYLPQVDWKGYLGDLKNHALILKSVTLDQAVPIVKDECKTLRRKVISLEERSSILNQQLEQSDAAAIDSHLVNLKTRYDEARCNADLDTNNDNAILTNITLNEERMRVNAETDAELTRTEKRMKEISARLEQLAELKEPADVTSKLAEELDKSKVPVLDLPQKPFAEQVKLEPLPVASTLKDCPSCGVDLEAYASIKIAEVNGANKAKLTEAKKEFNKVVKEWEKVCKELTNEHGKKNDALIKKRATLSEQLVKVKEAHAAEMKEYTQRITERATIQGELEHMKSKTFGKIELVEVSETVASVVAQRIQERQAVLNKLFEEYNQAMVASGAEEQRQAMAVTLRKELAAIPEQLAQTQQWLVSAVHLKEKLAELPGLMLDTQLANVRSFIPYVGMSFYKEIKSTGRLEPDLQFFYRGAAYGVLSNSYRISLGLDLSSMLNMLSGQCIHVFIDNAESVVSLPESVAKQQYFAAYVSAEHKELVISGR